MRAVILTVLVGLLMVAVPAVAFAIPQDIQRVAFIDDSFGTGYGASPGNGYLDLMEKYQAGDNILPVANNGATVRRYLPGGPWYSQLDQLQSWGATTVVIPLGTNDWYIARPTSEYQMDLGSLIAEVRSRVPNARVILWHHFGGYATPDPTICDINPCDHANPPESWPAFGTAMRNAAVSNNTGYIDDSVAYSWQNYLYTDRIHPNTSGHNLLFQSINYRLYYCC